MIKFPASPSYDLLRQFLKDNVPQMKRISEGAVELVWTYVRLAIDHGISINIDDEVYLPAAEARLLSKQYYVEIREACCIMKGYHNRLQGVCDRIIAWTPAFQSLFFNVLRAQVQSNRHNKQYSNLCPLRKQDKYHINLTPGADPSMYKHNPQKSARYYIGLQNIPRDMKAEIYEGCFDLDIVACFPQIFFREVMKRNRFANRYFNIMIDFPKLFLEMLEEDGVTTALHCNAKAARSRLFHPSQSVNGDGSRRKNRRTGVQWYDELADFIVKQLRDAGIDNEHLFFTGHEQRIVEEAFDIIGRENVVLRIHDGMICKDLVELETLCNLLEIKTGYSWSWKKL